mmetsp:Transcript_1506/g.2752  ORF Transcript_1506/g.2752 Transcript_1506/m.2752 type:complete len:274 (-) Transcript_1506:939-1760(-)
MLHRCKHVLKVFANPLLKSYQKRTYVVLITLLCGVSLPSIIFALFCSAPGGSHIVVLEDIREDFISKKSIGNPSHKIHIVQVVSNESSSENVSSSGNIHAMMAQEYLLSVPYYIYEDEILRNSSLLNYTDIYLSQDYSCNEKFGKLGTVDRTITFDEYLEVNRYYKHAGDIHFIRSALEHPMRTYNPEEAKLFVVPSLITKHIQEIIYKTSDVVKIKADEELRRLDEFLGNSEWFRRHMGRDHVAPVAHLAVDPGYVRKRIPNIRKVQYFTVL